MNDGVKLKRNLGGFVAFMGVFGCVISGTVMVSLGNVAGNTGSALWVPVLMGLIPMLCVAATYSELSSLIPGTGMVFDYTMPAMGRFFAIFATLSGYLLLVIFDGGTQMAIVGVAIQDATGIPALLVTIVMFAAAVLIHLLGVSFYGKFEAGASFIMVILMVFFGVMGTFGLGVSETVNDFTPLEPELGWNAAFAQTGACLWWYLGFEFICVASEENTKPHKTIPRALILGVIGIMLLDVLVAISGIKYVPLEILSTSNTPHIHIADAVMGDAGFYIMTAITFFAAFSSILVHLVSLPRFMYGLAYKDCAPKCFTYLHPKFRTPWVGIFFASGLVVCCIIYLVYKDYDTSAITGLINVACTTWICCYIIAMLDVFILRKKYPDFPRLWKMPAMPVIVTVGIIGLSYCLWTMHPYFIPAGISMACIAIYAVAWCKYKKLPMFVPEKLEDSFAIIRERSEPYEDWEKAVDEYLASR